MYRHHHLYQLPPQDLFPRVGAERRSSAQIVLPSRIFQNVTCRLPAKLVVAERIDLSVLGANHQPPCGFDLFCGSHAFSPFSVKQKQIKLYVEKHQKSRRISAWSGTAKMAACTLEAVRRRLSCRMRRYALSSILVTMGSGYYGVCPHGMPYSRTAWEVTCGGCHAY